MNWHRPYLMASFSSQYSKNWWKTEKFIIHKKLVYNTDTPSVYNDIIQEQKAEIRFLVGKDRIIINENLIQGYNDDGQKNLIYFPLYDKDLIYNKQKNLIFDFDQFFYFDSYNGKIYRLKR